ncbi:unnamed protein product [Meganyctiphanes norvegica]|uniref:Polycomb protein VEFS-Box domain-containing protein n=1 Tax=Meganyctiphanes norvegica TaxID=48144 RepID=A0AAV2R625_MEGNR
MKVQSSSRAVTLRKREATTPNGTVSTGEVAVDHELFLQAFEKPTQIYRYLKSRNILRPVFLQRNLYYMRGKMSRSHKNRATFRLDSLLAKVSRKNNALQNEKPASYLNISFTGFHDDKLVGVSGDVARVETFIVKMCHKKRKESTAPLMKISVGTQDVSINPSRSGGLCVHNKPATLTIPSNNFTFNNGHQVKSYVLVFNVVLAHDQENAGEPAPKRRRISRGVAQENDENIANQSNYISQDSHVTYSGEIVIFDKQGRCLLTPGQYELVLNSEVGDCSMPNQVSRHSPKKPANWETIETLKLEGLFNNKPLIRFNLSWSSDTNTSIDRPILSPLAPLDILLANSNSTKLKPQGVTSPEAPQLVIYQFVYNNNSRQQTEARRDFFCPWCSLNCIALYSLLKHLKLCHARFTFTYVPHQKGARIDVSLNECYDGGYAGNPQFLVAKPDGFAFSRSGPTRRTPTTTVLVCRPKRPKPSLSEFLEQDDSDFDLPRSYILGHNRLYHHSMTALPIQPHELDEDSEGEHDNEWVRLKTVKMIDEFTDVNEGEKQIMKMWNLHMLKYNFVGDTQTTLATTMFLEKHAAEIIKKNLYRNFLLHMVSMHDFGLIGNGVIYKGILHLQSKMDEPEIRAHFARKVAAQRMKSEDNKEYLTPLKEEKSGDLSHKQASSVVSEGPDKKCCLQ